MSGNTSFLPHGNTIAIVAGLASANTLITPATDLGSPGPSIFPGQVRLNNISVNTIYVSFSLVSGRTAVAPSAGTPSLEWALMPGTVEVFTLPVINGKVFGYVNTIASAATSTLLLTFGEGL